MNKPMDERPLMHCGCVAQAVDGANRPVCLMHQCRKLAREQAPNLDGRMARCTDCQRTTESSTSLPFFKHHPTGGWDTYYCGCRGWN